MTVEKPTPAWQDAAYVAWFVLKWLLLLPVMCVVALFAIVMGRRAGVQRPPP